MNIFYRIFFRLILFVLFVMPTFLYAASIYFVPTSGNYTVGEQFSVNVFVSNNDKEMNAVKATISSIGNNLQIVSVSQSGSIIDFWAQEPQLRGGNNVYFEGVMLGGGYSGSAGKIATLIVRARSKGNATLSVLSGNVLANDGKGTKLPTTLGTAHFKITGAKSLTAPIMETIPKDFIFTKNLQQKDKGDEVKYLQTCLKNYGFYTENITGYFGKHTKQAITDFQEYYRDDILVPLGFKNGTGFVQKTTREKLNAVCFIAPVVEEPKQPITERASIETTSKREVPFYTNVWFWVGTTAILFIIVILLLLIIISFLLRKTSKEKQQLQKQTLRKKGAVLRRTHKQLLTTKTKIEKELQETENKLKKFSEE